jgi:hypothetical protein
VVGKVEQVLPLVGGWDNSNPEMIVDLYLFYKHKFISIFCANKRKIGGPGLTI